jgi:sterol desaturase/sphingolipid hydroxylase (fatty acid hydroxylase superfamily)
VELLIFIMLGIVATYAAFAIYEARRPARSLPKIPRWRAKGALFFVLALALTTVLPMVWDSYLGEHRLIDATGLGTWLGALYGFVLLELGVYVWHRAMHRTPLLWRAMHQMHHSAERVDIWGSLYFHPLDAAGFSFVYSFMLVMVSGVTAEAALIANLAGTFCSLFQHANIRTPRWLGYIIQRPESHAAHHERGVHAYNYSDLPLWDIVFGTFKNPERFEGQNGFYDGASARIGEMLVGMDVSEPRAPRSQGASIELAA